MNRHEIITCFLDILYPRTCSVCGRVLNYQEKYLCIECLNDLPLTRFHNQEFNKVEQLFAGKILIERATSLIFYNKLSPYAKIIQEIKYSNNPHLGEWIAHKLSKPLIETKFFEGIDLIIPIPLHITKKAEREYNQSFHIAKGISKTANIPVTEKILKSKRHSTQTNKGITERWNNVQGIYYVKHPELIEGKHILLIDDVITTGATTISAATALKKVKDVKISILSLAIDQI